MSDTKQPLQFESLQISRQLWGKDIGRLTGAIEFQNQDAKMTVKLNEEQASKMLRIVAEAAAENAREVGQLFAQAITDRPAIEGSVAS